MDIDINAVKGLEQELEGLGLKRQRTAKALILKYRGFENEEIRRRLGVSKNVVNQDISRVTKALEPNYSRGYQDIIVFLYVEGALQRNGLNPCEIREIPYEGRLEDALSEEQMEVLDLVSDGVSNDVIADYLHCNVTHVGMYVREIKEITETDRIELVLLYHRQMNSYEALM